MKSALTLLLKRAFANASEFQPDRREFIRKSAWAVAALTLPLGGCQWLGRKPSVAIVGAGISGLSAAYQLKKLGIDFQIFEASGRSGGRVLTSPDAVIEGASVDFGAEFIDSTHEELISLATELNVELNDLRNDKLTSKTFYLCKSYFAINRVDVL